MAVVALPVAIAAGIVALVVASEGDDGTPATAAAPDPVAATYTDDVLARLDVTPEEFVDDVIVGLLPVEVADDETTSVRNEFAVAVDAASGAPADVAEAVVRRLGPDAGVADDAESLVDGVVEAVDPDRTIDDVESMLTALRDWSGQVTPHVLRITTGTTDDGWVDIVGSTFDEAVAVLDTLEEDARTIGVVPAGITGVTEIDVPSVSWSIDETDGSITFSGATDDVTGRADVVALAHWGDDGAGPTWTVAVRASEWRLADVGFDGEFARQPLPDTVIVLAGEDGTVEPFGTGVRVERGITAIAQLDGSTLPAEITTVIGATSSPLRAIATLGADFGAVDGTARPAEVSITIEVPELAPPALPSGFQPSVDIPWAVTLDRIGEITTIGATGGLDVELDGELRTFSARVGLSGDGNTAAGRLTAAMTEPWREPFGLGWLDLDTATMAVDLDGGARTANFEAAATVAGRDANVTFELATAGSANEFGLEVAIERLTADDAVTLVATTTDADLPGEVPDLAIDDVLIDVTVGDATSLAVGGSATVAGASADVLVAGEAVAGERAMLVGLALDGWSLPDLVPAAGGTVLEELTFPSSALVLSSLDVSVDRSELSSPTRRFFDQTGVDGPIRLSPGLSLLSSLDLSDTALAEPLGALGLDDGRFPVVGTLPGTAIDSGGATSTRGLSLAVQLPDVAPAGAPDWFLGGRLSLVATGAPSLGLEGEMNLRIDGEDLRFTVGAEFARSGPGVELALFGQLAADRPWESPFGIDWLTVNDAALQLTIDPIGTVGLGFGGSVVIGERSIDVAIATEITAGVPTNFALQGATEDGLAFSDIVALQGSIASTAGAPAASLGNYPDLAVRDLEIRFAPQAFERLGIEAGFALAGDVYIGQGGSSVRFASLDLLIDESGVVAAGRLTGYDLGPISWSDIALDLAFTASQQRFEFDGEASLFGLSARADIELDSDSVFFTGQQLLDDLRRAVDLFEQLVDDPVGTLEQLPALFEAAGVPLPEWAEAIVDAIVPLTERGVALSDAAIDKILKGGKIELPISPPNGEEPDCIGIPIEVDGRCYGTPPIPATGGLPEGGEAPECSRLTPRLSDGRCYSSAPKGEVCLASWKIGDTTYGMQLRNGRCYAKVAKVIGDGYNYFPSRGLAPTIDRGVPVGGDEPVCRIENPIDIDGDCYSVPPTPAVPGFPEGGSDPGCRLFWTLEDGRCWRISPSQAEDGLGTPGICSRFGIECRLEDLVSGRLAQTLFDDVIDRLTS